MMTRNMQPVEAVRQKTDGADLNSARQWWTLLFPPITAWVLFWAALLGTGVAGVVVCLVLVGIIGGWRHWQTRPALSTEDRTAELREKQVELQAILQSFPDLYFWLNADGTIQKFHANHTSDLYLPPEQFTGKTMHEVLPAPLGQSFAVKHAQALSTGTVAELEYSLP